MAKKFTAWLTAIGVGDGQIVKRSGATVAGVSVGAAAGTVAAGDDPRMSDARAPNTHAASHKNGGSDEIATASSSANAIPKADANGLLDAWTSVAVPATLAMVISKTCSGVVPPCVTQCRSLSISGGGAGGASDGSFGGGGGGGGGLGLSVTACKPGQPWSVVMGAGGIVGGAAAVATVFTLNGVLQNSGTVGGPGGNASGAQGTAGAKGTGQGNGGNGGGGGGALTNGGGGGGGAGTVANGGDGLAVGTAGARDTITTGAAVLHSGIGGTGAGAGVAVAPDAPGGGGAGASTTLPATNGANGALILVFT